METFFIIIIIISILLISVLITLVMRLQKKIDAPVQKQDDQSLALLLHQMNALSRAVDEKLGDTQREMSNSLKYQSERSHELIKEITREITEVKKTGEQVMSFTEQLQDLQNMLKNPKQRGILGEYYLETTLKNVLPPGSYQMQYTLTKEDIVDAVVFVKDKIIPIDSKFSLENYTRIADTTNESDRLTLERAFKNDLKKRIDETSKYIQPEHGTMDFAFMFIPHEAIYYDLLVAEIGGMKINTADLIEYAFKKKVLIVSPTSFLAFLQTVLQGLRSLQIEESAKEIQKRVAELGNHLQAYETYMQKLGSTLGTTVNHYNHAYKELKKVDKDVLRITGESLDIDPLLIEKPTAE
ncbi:MAG: DNA recombination protein RmuC [Candidatus Pacebacteria bacterium]|nr:DNA recombination protein RmuC [Candidatus Paceibacterota bacterium]MCD8528278.1 DNA recombination protein RmuC [Candidatus Paceibacterota bacterium]MCD8563967.1 DNA recombination protein RmuC [Candidatus Paceibacterota bacterium]